MMRTPRVKPVYVADREIPDPIGRSTPIPSMIEAGRPALPWLVPRAAGQIRETPSEDVLA